MKVGSLSLTERLWKMKGKVTCCYGSDVSVPINPHVGSLTPQVMVLAGRTFRWVEMEVRMSPHEWIKRLCKKRPQSKLPCSLRSATCGYKEKTAICIPGEPSPDAECAGTLTLDSPASRTVGNRSLLFQPICGPLLWQPRLTRTLAQDHKAANGEVGAPTSA